LKKAMRDAQSLFADIVAAYPENLRELKTSRLAAGKGGWRQVDPKLRKELICRLCELPSNINGGKVIPIVIDRDRFRATRTGEPWRKSEWVAGATCLAIAAQRSSNSESNNKGLTVLVFDDNRAELPGLSEFLVNPTEDVAEFCESNTSDPFDQIIDTSFAIKSEHSTLVQIADACAYILRRRAELTVERQDEAWDGELDFIQSAYSGFAGSLLQLTKTWKSNPCCEAAEWLKQVSIDDFLAWSKA